jgi:CDP-diacylglycerol--serine O-phosphatidyltransferase
MHEENAATDRTSRRRGRRKKAIAVVPSLLTLGNAACGFGCITYAAKVGPEIGTPNDVYYAALLIFAAMVFDALDGPVARLAKQTSEFGAQLDSLADVISFGVAPAFLMLKCSRVFHPRLLWVIAVLYVLCAVLRLARFNVTKDTESAHQSFRGLPSPAAAGMVASLVIIAPGLVDWTDPELSESAQRVGEWVVTVTSWALPVITFAAACLMVSRVRYPHVVNQFLGGRHTFQHLVKVIFALVVIFAIHELAIPVVFFYFVMASPIRAAWSRLAAWRTGRGARQSASLNPPG